MACRNTKATALAFMICRPRSAHPGLLAETGQSRLQTAMMGRASLSSRWKPIAVLDGALIDDSTHGGRRCLGIQAAIWLSGRG